MNLLLEIGGEEIPDWMLAGALEYLGGAIGDLLKQHQLGEASDPHRCDAAASGGSRRRRDRAAAGFRRARLGPGEKRAARRRRGLREEAGRRARASRNPLRRQSGEVQLRPQDRGPRRIAKSLPKHCRQLILKTPFPKTMYWTGKGGARFIRPIRWIVALLDDQVIPFEIADVESGNESSGHRKLGAARFPVTYENYEQKLRENFVHPLRGRAPQANPSGPDEVQMR